MIETLLGGLLGGAFRLAPEILKWLDRKGERGHELAMQDKALEFEKLRGAQRMSEIGAGADAAWNVGAIETLREAVRTQGEKTGVRWADALSISVRPVITYWFMALYCAAKTAAFAAAVTAGAGWGTAILHAWTEADQALWAARSFEVAPLMSSQLADQEARRLILTKDQIRVLDFLRSRRRVAVSGGAGRIAGNKGWIPQLSAGVRSGSKALSYIGLVQGSTPPGPRRSSNLSARTPRNPH